MRPIPTKPTPANKSLLAGFSPFLHILMILLFIQVSSIELHADCGVPPGYVAVGSGVSDTLDDLSEVIGLDTHNWVIKGHLNINQDASLTGYRFLMDPGSSLITIAAIDISFDDCKFVGCTALWQGISLNSTCTLSMNNCYISDALSAVYLTPKGSGANFNINQCFFNNNSVSIRTSGISSGILVVTYCRFAGVKDGLLNGSTALTGILINHSTPGFYADGNIFDGIQNGVTCFADVYNLTEDNVYTNIINDSNIEADNPLGSGIGSGVRILGGYNIKRPKVKVTGYLYGSYKVGPTHEIYNDNFSNCVRGVYITSGGIGTIVNNDFIDCGYGITISNSGPGSYSKLMYNSITNPTILGLDFKGNLSQFSSLAQYNKITMNSMKNPNLIAAARVLATPTFDAQFVNISDNTISISNGGVGIDLDGTAYTEVKGTNNINVVSGKAYKGLYMHNKTNSCYITGTRFLAPDRIYSATYTKNKIGLYLYESENNMITCNYFNGPGVSLNAIDNCSGTIFQHNEFAGGADGLTMGSESGLAAIIDDQYATGNLWTSTYTHHDAVNYNPSCYGKFYIYPEDKLPYLDNKYWPNKGAVPSQGDFLNAYDPGASIPVTDCGHGISSSVHFTGIELKIINDDYKGLPPTDYFKHSGKWKLFDKIKTSPSLLESSSEATAFFANERSTPQYQIWKVASAFQDASALDENTATVLRENEVTKDALYEKLGGLLPQWSPKSNDSKLVAEINGIIKTINDIDVRTELVNDEWTKRFKSVINTLKSDLESITTTNEMDKNMKQVLDIKMTMSLDPNAVPTQETITILSAIAAQCRLEGGEAVFVAKNILKSIGIKVKEDSDICGEEKLQTATEQPITYSYDTNIYPNPGSATLEVDLQTEYSGSTQLQITDILGFVKLTSDVIKGHNVINTSDLAPGLYMVLIKDRNGVQKSIKWIKE